MKNTRQCDSIQGAHWACVREVLSEARRTDATYPGREPTDSKGESRGPFVESCRRETERVCLAIGAVELRREAAQVFACLSVAREGASSEVRSEPSMAGSIGVGQEAEEIICRFRRGQV